MWGGLLDSLVPISGCDSARGPKSKSETSRRSHDFPRYAPNVCSTFLSGVAQKIQYGEEIFYICEIPLPSLRDSGSRHRSRQVAHNPPLNPTQSNSHLGHCVGAETQSISGDVRKGDSICYGSVEGRQIAVGRCGVFCSAVPSGNRIRDRVCGCRVWHITTSTHCVVSRKHSAWFMSQFRHVTIGSR
jgi:hypothetical protein